MSHSVAGSDFRNTLKVTLKTHPVPVMQAHMGKRCNSFPKLRLKLHCVSGGGLGFGKGLNRRSHTSAGQHRMRVRNSAVGGRKTRLIPQSLLEAFDTLSHALLRTPVPEVTTPKIHLVRQRIDGSCLVRVQTPLFVWSQFYLD